MSSGRHHIRRTVTPPPAPPPADPPAPPVVVVADLAETIRTLRLQLVAAAVLAGVSAAGNVAQAGMIWWVTR
jgi:hypothetical protein